MGMKMFPKGLAIGLGLSLYAMVLFRVVWPSGVVIHSQDYNYGLMAMYKAELPGAFFEGFWRGFPLLGRVGSTPPTFTNLSLSVLPIEFYMDWIYAIHLLLSSAFLIGFLRLRKLDWIPALFGALTAFWLGSNLTLIHPGHLLKYGVVLCAAATLFCLEKTHQTRSWRWAILSGGSLGWMFMHQADVALFFGLVLGAYHLFRLSESCKNDLPKLGSFTALLLAVAGLLFWESYQSQMDSQVRNVEVLQQGTEEEKWEFANQWSFPPSESLDLIAPGYWGWTSQHETAPYHGVTGQSAEWRAVQEGFPNFRLESVYLGILPLGLGFLSLFSGKNRRRETVFWSLALVFTLLLSFGKFTPVYRLFFELPLANAIRNPNKFLQVFQLCAGVLAAMGLQFLLETEQRRIRNRTVAGFLGVSLILGAASLFTQPQSASQLAAFADTLWASRATTILQNRQLALLHASLLGAWGALCVVALRTPKLKPLAGIALVLAVLVDGLLLGRQYLKPAPVDFIQENALADFLTENLGTGRVAVMQQDGISTFYLTHLFPAHHIAFADIAVAPRLEEDYQAYFDAIGTNRIRMWQEFGVKYVLAPRSLADQLFQQIPSLRSALREAWSYTLAQTSPGVLEILPGSNARPGNLLVLELRLPSDRFMLMGNAISADEDAFLSAVQENELPFSVARVHSPDFKPMTSTDPTGSVSGALSTSDGFLLQVEVDTPRALLRLADRYDPALRARINGGAPQPLLRTDLLFAGLELPQGIHEIELTAELPKAGRVAQAAGFLLCLFVGLSLLISRMRPSSESRLQAEVT
jgi:hypothetical protein